LPINRNWWPTARPAPADDDPTTADPDHLSEEIPGPGPRRPLPPRQGNGCLVYGSILLATALIGALIVLGILLVSGVALFEEEEDTDEEALVDEDVQPLYELGSAYVSQTYSVEFPTGWQAFPVEGSDGVVFASEAATPDEPFENGIISEVGAGQPFADETIILVSEDTPLAPETYLADELSLANGDEDDLLYSDLENGEIAGRPAAWTRALDIEGELNQEELVLAIQVEEQLFVFTGYAAPARADELMAAMIRMAQSLTVT
jgi:hypothetical protein